MDDNDPKSSATPNGKNPITTEGRPARRESQSKPGVPAGTQLSSDAHISANPPSSTEELSLNYPQAAFAEYSFEDLMPALISDHLKAPSLDGIDPESMSLAQAQKGFNVLIPSSSYLRPGDTFNLLWGGVTYPAQRVDELNVKQSIMGTQWLFSSPTSFLRQGKVQVCYDVFRDGVRVGTSAILHVKLQDFYSTNDKQKSRKTSFQRKNRPKKKDD
ncbi:MULTISPECIES: hypothetical protein [unclassified Pseudomonas]|uniref:hypothetical protein n=2 Tax=Pseudomonas TaxID=286 RepID=UPI002AC99E09|nr:MULTISPECIES: hypothetical protein [unclassified Pseudomonas]MEB0042261.1 hypothetical protein [Pseudomonas sp. MH10]MEB0122671.1 hypothetical protein [Pseudomonas sp. CCI1.2]WPX65551.1 hypothetical protein RHM59_07875 [Pseudomonas sp. MH10]